MEIAIDGHPEQNSVAGIRQVPGNDIIDSRHTSGKHDLLGQY